MDFALLGVAKKLYPDRETHFFHFPIKNRERCIQWCVYSNNMDFLSLPDEKLKNKVVCDFHFQQNFFMNFKREKLNKTNAVPTIYVTDEGEIDLLEQPMDWVEVNQAQAEIPEVAGQKNIDMDEYPDTIEFEVSELPPPVKKAKTDLKPVKILNIEHIEVPKVKIVQSTPKPKTFPSVPRPSSVTKTTVKTISPPKGYSIRRVSPPQRVEQVANVIKYDTEELTELPEMMIYETDEQHVEMVASNETNNEIKTILQQCMKDNAEIKELLISQQKSTANRDSQSSSSSVTQQDVTINQSHLNKVQLFNGIKRYLSPAMVALLRMDLFTSSAPRDFKPDEKVICTEILQFGPEVYNFLLDEWRLRLPSRDKVEKWIEEKQLQDEDDAS